MAARPRGGDWLEDEISSWRRAGINIVLSLLTPEEELDLNLNAEEKEVTAQGLEFWSFPICDREVPRSDLQLTALLERADHALSMGKNIVLHCRQGIGRTGLVAACLLVRRGGKPESAVKMLSTIRGVSIPETIDQLRWIGSYASFSSNAKKSNPPSNVL
jgi:protein-tyrosine phosphatase